MNRNRFLRGALAVSALFWVVSQAFAQTPLSPPPPPGGTPDYFGVYPNYANSPLPVYDAATNTVTPGTGLRKFVDELPGLCGVVAAGKPCIPLAHADTLTYPGSDYYEIALQDYFQQMHSDLPPTKLRGYVQLNNGTNQAGTANDVPPGPISYLGPIIVAQRNRPVRIKFINQLDPSAGGNLFIPVDPTVMGAGAYDLGGGVSGNFSQKRATLHLHGGTTPWISDGTPHQWTTPTGDDPNYPKGVSTYNVPDMPDPGDGSMTFFYSNQQSARLMFYHDHAYGITRLNVYAGEAAGYLLADPAEEQALANLGVPGTLSDLGHMIPLVIQDKTWVPDNTQPYTNVWGPFPSQLQAQDPTWNNGTGRAAPGLNGNGDLWFPHVYLPVQNPSDLSGYAAMGRWMYSPWFWPPAIPTYGPVPNPYCLPTPGVDCSQTPWEHTHNPGTPNPSIVSEAWMDSMVVNGTAYPYLVVDATTYRFRILNAANDRIMNLQLYVAQDPATITYPTGYSGPGLQGFSTEVKLQPPAALAAFPTWPSHPESAMVPDPTTRGPAMVQIGTEGGVLPAPVVLPNHPVDWNWDWGTFDFSNVNTGTLTLAPAERADVIVDFSAYAGKTIILYNDAPAPFPAGDPRQDYFTGKGDMSDVGGSPDVLPGYGPNTRTILQIRVNGGGGGGTPVGDEVNTTLLAALQAAATGLPKIFHDTQDTIIYPVAPYNAVYGGNFPGNALAYAGIATLSKTFTPIGATQPVTIDFKGKTIQDEMGEAFDREYGRMAANLGVQLPRTGTLQPNMLLYSYIDPPTEVVNITSDIAATPIGTLGDGTQIWKITHNGVDTHPVHWHMYSVQLINRVSWSNNLRLPDPNELGWKDTVRVNPLQDTIVALRPIKLTNVPFPLPNSVRPLDPTKPIGSMMGFTNVNPTDGTILTPPITNELTNFGWEYVWHCHILGHEEFDMMRSQALAVPPEAPSNMYAVGSAAGVDLSWTDNSLSELSFTVERATDVNFTTPVPLDTLSAPQQAGYGTAVTITDTTAIPGKMYYYRVYASNTVGSTVPGFPTATVVSAYSNVTPIHGLPLLGFSPNALSFGNQGVMGTSEAQPITLFNNDVQPLAVSLGFTGANPGDFAQTNDCGVSLAPGTTCTINVTFRPTAVGPRTATLSLNNGQATTALDGTGVLLITASATASPAPNAAGWNNSPVTVTIVPADNGGPLVASISYSLDGVNFTVDPGDQPVSIVISTEGTTTVTYYATDVNGASSPPQTLTVMLDTILPTASAVVAPAPNAYGWNNTDPTITITAADVGSGLASITYSATGATDIAPTVVNSNTATLTIVNQGTTTVTYFATDNAGNQSALQTVTIKLDKSGPRVTATLNPSSAPMAVGNVVVTVTGSVKDTRSGVDLGSGSYWVKNGAGATVASGVYTIAPNAAYTFTVSLSTATRETYRFTVRAFDLAGNSGFAGPSFRVR